MWRHCLRVYNKMAELENGEDEVISDNVGAGSRDGNATRSKKKPRIKRSTAHHEAALVATSKLAMWEEAVKIYRKVEESSATKNALASNARNDGMGSYPRSSPSAGVNTTQNAKDKSKNGVTDNMVLSVINACVKGSRVKQTTSQITVGAIVNSNLTSSSANVTSKPPVSPPPSRSTLRWLAVDERRRPLDAARNIVLTMEVSLVRQLHVWVHLICQHAQRTLLFIRTNTTYHSFHTMSIRWQQHTSALGCVPKLQN